MARSIEGTSSPDVSKSKDYIATAANNFLRAHTDEHALHSLPDSKLGELVNTDDLDPIAFLSYLHLVPAADSLRKDLDHLEGLMYKLRKGYATLLEQHKPITLDDIEDLLEVGDITSMEARFVWVLSRYSHFLLSDARRHNLFHAAQHVAQYRPRHREAEKPVVIIDSRLAETEPIQEQ